MSNSSKYEIKQAGVNANMVDFSYQQDVDHYKKVARDYMRDSGGNSLLEWDSPAWSQVDAALVPASYRVSNLDLAVLSTTGFEKVSADIRMSTSALSKETAELGKYVQNAHEETMEALKAIQQNVKLLNSNIVTMNGNINSIAGALAAFRGQFEAYADRDARVQAAQRATTQMGNLEQQLETQFGQNKELRRIAEGIMQATDLAGVRTETILSSAEELMVKTPRYWLAPAVLVLARWVSASQDSSENDIQKTRQVMSNMLNEAYRRDRNKTALFFGVVCRRANLIEESNAWFEDYMSFQTPDAVDRSVVMLLNLYTGGAMGEGEAEAHMLGLIYKWQYDQLHDPSGAYRKQLVNDWKAKCRELIEFAPASHSDFQALEKFSQIWDSLSHSLKASQLHHEFIKYMNHELGLRDFKQDTNEVLDSALRSLVSDYDGEELPIRREYEYQKLIVDLGGNKQVADTLRGIKDDILTETKPMVSILTDAARDSNLTSSTAATHVFALKSQMPWIKEAYEEVVADYRKNTPRFIPFALGDWAARTADGSDEQQLCNDFRAHVDKAERDALNKAANPKAQTKFIVGLVLLVVGLVFMLMMPPLGVILLIAGGVMAYKNYKAKIAADKKAEEIRDDMANRRKYGAAIISKLCAEVRDYRGEYRSNEIELSQAESILQKNTVDYQMLSEAPGALEAGDSEPVDATIAFGAPTASEEPVYETE